MRMDERYSLSMDSANTVTGIHSRSGDSPLMCGEEDEKCICELCECGMHHCPHNGWPGGGSAMKQLGTGMSEYSKSFTGKATKRRHAFFPMPDNLTAKNMGGAGGNGGLLSKDTTTHRSHFRAHSVLERVEDMNPEERSHTPHHSFNATSTHKADFIEFPITDAVGKPFPPPPPVFASLRNRVRTAPMESHTTHRDDFRIFPQHMHAPKIHHPAESQYFAPADTKLSETTTTYQDLCAHGRESVAYNREKIENRLNKKLRQSHLASSTSAPLHAPAVPFTAISTHQADFGRKTLENVCPAELALSRRDRSFTFLGTTKDGHRVYRHLARLSGGTYRSDMTHDIYG